MCKMCANICTTAGTVTMFIDRCNLEMNAGCLFSLHYTQQVHKMLSDTIIMVHDLQENIL